MITVNLIEHVFNQFGEAEESRIPYRIWARVFDLDRERQALEGTIRDSGRRDWEIRWLDVIAAQPASALEVVDDGKIWTILSFFEITRDGRRPDLRRRKLRLEGGRGSL